MSKIVVSIVVDLMSDLSATCCLNFRSTVASCSFRMISVFSVFPCCVTVNVVFQKSRFAVHFLLAILFCRCSCSLTIHLCVLVFKIMARPKSGLVRSFSGFLLFFSLHSVFGGASPLPAFLSQILIPAACWQGSRQCDLRCVL